MLRLESVSVKFVKRLRRCSPERQRAVALAAIEIAVSETGLKHSEATEAIESLRSGQRLSAFRKSALDRLVVEFDDEYFRLQEAADDGRASADDYLRPFGRARAVAAILALDGDDPFKASAEAIYEVTATTDDPDAILTRIESAMR